MAPKTYKTVPKISVKIWHPLIEKLDTKIKNACLRRDAYLEKILAKELDWLDQEVSIPNSEASYKYVADSLQKLDLKLVSLALPAELTTRLNEICSRKRIVRDAFFNRLFFLLAVAPGIVDALLFQPEVREEWRREVWSQHNHDGPFFQNGFYPLEPMIDPFWAIRVGMEMYIDKTQIEEYVEPTSGETIQVIRDLAGVRPVDSVYTVLFDKKLKKNDLLGLNCYMPDWQVPGQDARENLQLKLDEMLAELEIEEAS